MPTKNVLAVCSCGIATSSVVVIKLKELSAKYNLDLSVDKCMVNEYPTKIRSSHYDLIVTTSRVPNFEVPVINGIAFLTGVGVEALEQSIIQYLKKDN